MRLNKPVQPFYNFKGLYSSKEAGLISDDSTTGVYASEIQNVDCQDGTITFRKGLSKEDNGTTEVTMPTLGAGEVFNDSYSFTKLSGEIVRVLFTNQGRIYVYDSTNNKYVLAETYAALGTTNNLNWGKIYVGNTSANIAERDSLFFGFSQYAPSTNLLSSSGPTYYWNCKTARYASSTATTIVVDSTTGFRDSTETGVGRPFDLTLVVDGIKYTYTGKNATTFTGVTPNPTGNGHVANALVIQAFHQNIASMTSAITTNPDIWALYKGRLVIASSDSSRIAMSVVGDPFDFTTTGVGNRILLNVGDGNGPTRGLGVLKDNLIVFKKNGIIPVKTQLSEDGAGENTLVKPIIGRDNIGLISKNAMAVGDNDIIFISEDKNMKSLSQVLDGSDIPSIGVVSEAIDTTLKGLDYTECRGQYHDNNAYFACRGLGDASNDTVIQYDRLNKSFYFHAMPANSFYVVSNELFITSSLDVQTYRWLPNDPSKEVYSDDEGSIAFLWRSPRHKMGDAFRKKKSALFMVQMRISQNTTVNTQIDYGHLGMLHSVNFDIAGDGSSSDSGTYVISAPVANTFGSNPYGIEPYGSKESVNSEVDLVDVVAFKSIPLRYQPYDFTVQFSANDTGQRAKIISYGFVVETKDEVPKRSLIDN